MKKNFNVVKIISIVVFTFLCLFTFGRAKAETISVGSYVGRTYMKKARVGMVKYLRSQWVLKSDGEFVYCLEPWTDIEDNKVYIEHDANAYNELSKDIMNRVILLAYYGYGYEGHEDENWYTITQMVIWKTVDPNSDYYFTEGLNGERISLYENEMAELNNLVDQHSILPSFANQSFTTSISKDFTVTDNNNVLNKFKVGNGSSFARIEGNNLIVNGSNEGTKEIELVKSTNKYDSVPIVYASAESQNVMTVGNFNDIKTTLSVQFKSGKINLTKKAEEESYNDKITLEGAVYDVYNEQGYLVGTITTDVNGFGFLDQLPFGKYTIKESKPSYGYNLDLKEYSIEINENLLISDLTVYEQLDKREIEINKRYLDAYTEEFKNEEGIYFDIYTEDGQTLVASLLTDKDGKGSISLPYGTYLVKQRNSKSNYYKVADFKITIDENTEDKLVYDLVNYPKIRIVPKKEIVEVPIEITKTVEKEVVKVVEVPNTGKEDIYFLNYLMFMIKILVLRKCKLL